MTNQSSAMVQMSNSDALLNNLNEINNLIIFGRKIQIM